MPSFSRESRKKLLTCSNPIQLVFFEVIRHVDCTIVCGLRTTKEQQLLYAQGRTMPGAIVTNLDGVTKKSKHQAVGPDFVFSNAVDAVPYPIDWKDRDRFYHFAGFVRGVASQMGIDLIWGGDWDSDYALDDQSFYDYPHFEVRT